MDPAVLWITQSAAAGGAPWGGKYKFKRWVWQEDAFGFTVVGLVAWHATTVVWVEERESLAKLQHSEDPVTDQWESPNRLQINFR